MNVSSTHSIQTKLWEEFLDGDHDAIERLYTHLFPKIFLYCYSYLKNKEEAKDMVQEVFTRLIEKKDKNIYDVEGWLKQTAWFCLQNSYRVTKNRKKHQTHHIDKRPVYSQNHNTLRLEQLVQLIERTLTPLNAQIIFLDSKGFKNEEIAEKLGLTDKQVRTRKSEAKTKLKRVINRNSI